MTTFYINNLVKRTCILVVVCFAFYSCAEKKDGKEKTVVGTIVFDNLEQCDLSEIISGTGYLCLKDSGNLKLCNIDKVVRQNDKYYILDKKSQKVFVCDRNGKVLHKVGERGRGHLEYLRCHDIAVGNDGDVYISDGQSDKILHHDSHYVAINECKHDFDGTHFFAVNPNTFLIALEAWNKGDFSGKRFLLCDSSCVATAAWGVYDGNDDIDVTYGTSGFTKSDKYIAYHATINDSIYLFNDKSGQLEKIIHIDFGDKSVKPEIKCDIEKNIDDIQRLSFIQCIRYVDDNIVVGVLRIEDEREIFLLDMRHNKIYLSHAADMDEGKAYIDNQFVSVISTGHAELPDTVKQHIEKGHLVMEFRGIDTGKIQ